MISQVEDKPKEVPIPEYYTWEKGDDWGISKHFSQSEFSCRCNFPECIDQRISSDLVNRLDKLRDQLGQPIHVTSGFRCAKYQKVLTASGIQTAVGLSQHELGNAADIVPQDGTTKAALVLAYNLFDAIGIATNFLHLDTRPKKSDNTPRHWRY